MCKQNYPWTISIVVEKNYKPDFKTKIEDEEAWLKNIKIIRIDRNGYLPPGSLEVELWSGRCVEGGSNTQSSFIQSDALSSKIQIEHTTFVFSVWCSLRYTSNTLPSYIQSDGLRHTPFKNIHLTLNLDVELRSSRCVEPWSNTESSNIPSNALPTKIHDLQRCTIFIYSSVTLSQQRYRANNIDVTNENTISE